MPSKEVTLINDKVLALFEQMEPRHIALLIAKILNPEANLAELADSLWPELSSSRRKTLVVNSHVNQLFPLIRDRPWVLATIIAHKIAPLAVAALYEMMMGATKENVRVTAAKEVVRLAQSTYTRMAPSPDEPVPTEELDEALDEASLELAHAGPGAGTGELQQEDSNAEDQDVIDGEAVLLS